MSTIPGLSLDVRCRRASRTGRIVGDNRQVTVVMHGKPWAGWPGGEPQSVRDAYDELLAGKGELWPAEGGAGS